MTDTHEHSNYYFKYLEYCEHFNSAHHFFDISQEGDPNWIVHSWHELLLAEEAVYLRKSTPRQKEVQRLWQQRGLLERTKANLSSVWTQCKHEQKFESAAALAQVGKVINKLINDNKFACETVKERIPK